MGFAKTKEELDRYYALGTRKFFGAKMLGVMFATKPEIVTRLLPAPLVPADAPNGLMFIADYPETNLGPGYREAALFLQCKYNGEQGTYCLSMPINREERMFNGRDVFGFPKKMADIHLERKDNAIHAWVERKGVRFVEVKATMAGKLPELPKLGPTYLFKALPKIDLSPGFDGPVMLCSQRTEIALKSLDIGGAEVTLKHSESDPWAEVEIEKVVAAFYLVSDNTMLPGKVLAEVDPKSFLPHYFKMTDFFVG